MIITRQRALALQTTLRAQRVKLENRAELLRMLVELLLATFKNKHPEKQGESSWKK